jgi:hypothetical protein
MEDIVRGRFNLLAAQHFSDINQYSVINVKSVPRLEIWPSFQRRSLFLANFLDLYHAQSGHQELHNINRFLLSTTDCCGECRRVQNPSCR